MPERLDTLSLILLAGIAALALIQGLLLLGAAWQAFRAVRRGEGLAGRMGRELRPAVHELGRAARDVAELSELTLMQARRLDGMLTDAAEKVERAQRALRRVLPLAGRVAAAGAAVRLLRSGIRAYRRLRR